MGGNACSKACCCWKNSSTRTHNALVESSRLIDSLDIEEFHSAREAAGLRAATLTSSRQQKPGSLESGGRQGNSSTRGTFDLEASDVFATADSTFSQSPSRQVSVITSPKPTPPPLSSPTLPLLSQIPPLPRPALPLPSPPLSREEGDEVVVSTLDEVFVGEKGSGQSRRGDDAEEGDDGTESELMMFRPSRSQSLRKLGLDPGTSTSADGGVALSSYVESAPQKGSSAEKMFESGICGGLSDESLDVISTQLTLLGLDRQPGVAESINEIWLKWYKPEARRFYSAKINLLRVRQLPDDWFKAEPTLVPHDDSLPTIEETLWIYRFVQARQGSVEAALVMLKEDLTWREEINVEGLWRESVSDEFRRKLFSVYPHGYYGCDKTGRPVYYDRLGRIDAKRLLLDFNQQDVEHHWIRGYEMLLRRILLCCSLAAGRRIFRGLTVLDLHNVSMGTFSKARELLTVLIGISQNHYPECMEKTYIIRSNWAFRAIWRLVKPLLSQETVKKVRFVEPGCEVETLRAEIGERMPAFIADAENSSIEWCLEPIGPWVGDGQRLETILRGHHELFEKNI